MAPWAPINLPNYDPLRADDASCQISEHCHKPVRADIIPRPVRAQQCDVNDLDCICGQDPSLKDNKYFDSHCLFEECKDIEARKAFVNAFLAACARNQQQAANIPAEWAPFLCTGLPRSTQLSSTNTCITSTGLTVRSTLVATSRLGSTMSSSLITAMTSSTKRTADALQPSSTNWADFQIPICGITLNCLVATDKIDPCKMENLSCVVKNSSSIGRSPYFKPSCLFESCYSELGRREWMDAFAYACTKVGKDILDITPQWEPYVPKWYLDVHASSSSTTAASVTPTNVTIVPNNAHIDLSEGAIAGISVAAAAAALLLAICGLVFWRKDQKLKLKSREVAHMADAMQPGGVQQRIDQLTYGSSSDEELRLEPGPKEYYAHEQTSGDGSGVRYGCEPSPPLFNLRADDTPHPRGNGVETPYPHPLQYSHSTGSPPMSYPPSHRPYPYERNIARSVSYRSKNPTRMSTESMGTTAVTSSPVQRYSVDHDAAFASASVRKNPRAPQYDEHGGKVAWG